MKKCISDLFTCVLVACLFFSCKKNAGNATQNCLLSSLTDSASAAQSVTQFSYDNSNRLTTIIVTGQNACKRTLQYIGNTIVFSVTDTTPGIMSEIDTAVLNSSNLIQTETIYYPTIGATYVITYYYDLPGIAQATSSIITENGEPGDTIGYAIVNGNLMYDSVKGQTAHNDDFTYYSSENIIYGDPTYFRQLFYFGAYYYINKNMLNVLYSPGISYKAYTYSFNNNRISQAILRKWVAGSADTVTHLMSYSYSCK